VCTQNDRNGVSSFAYTIGLFSQVCGKLAFIDFIILFKILADRTNGRPYGTTCCQSVSLSVAFCVFASYS